MIALMSLADPDRRAARFSRLGSTLMMFCKMGIRKASVFPVPVRAWANLPEASMMVVRDSVDGCCLHISAFERLV